MPAFLEWLDRLLTDGLAVMSGPPQLADGERPAIVKLLRRGFEQHALDVAGPALPFDSVAAFDAALRLADACWLVVTHDEPVRPDPPLLADVSPAAHLACDLTFRFLPAVFRRARLRSHDGPLTVRLVEWLRRRPLSGVLADLDDPPLADLQFGGHAGLQLLYAERLVERPRPPWLPVGGPARERVDWIFHERGRAIPAAYPRGGVSA